MATDPDLHKDIADLSEAVRKLTQRFSAKEDLAKKAKILAETTRDITKSNRRLIKVMCVVFAIAILLSIIAWDRSNDSIQQNRRDAYIGCLNNNESRKAMIDIWNFILGWELADDSEAQAPAETEMSRIILPYIHHVYRKRDCTDLDKKYPIDDPPTPPPPAR